jgi:diguanylate cyclase (GGDEF)-like protein
MPLPDPVTSTQEVDASANRSPAGFLPPGRLTLAAIQRNALSRWRARRVQEAALAGEFRLENLRRLRYMACVIVPLNLVHVAVFGQTDPTALGQVVAWRHGVLLCHLCMAVAMSVLGLLAHGLLTRWRSAASERAVLLVTLIVSLGFAGLLGVVDQWVTPSITPVLVGCLGVALVFLIRPLPAVGLFGLAGVLIAWGLGLTQHSPAVLLSNRVNTLTGVMMGAALAILLWHKSVANSLLRRELLASNLTLERQQAELQRLVTLDPLTGLINRREFERLFSLELARARRADRPTTLVAIDLDHFKHVNDEFGHPVGDVLLQQVGQRLLAQLRPYDVLARYGGEEFMLLLADTDPAAAQAAADKLRVALQQQPFSCAERSLTISASMGVATTWASAATFEQLYAQADQALYRAKQLGRNRVETAPVPA